jgi:glucosamine kinase
VAYYLGIDGGGSKTTCAVGDEVSQLATVTVGPSNIIRVGEVRARESLHQAIRETCAVAGISPQQVARACVGAAGAGREHIAGEVRKLVGEVISGEIEVVGDMEIALAAAFGTGQGVIVIAGTGSIAYGRDAQGRTARAGGWGFAISDEGSAHWIGRAAVSALLHAADQVGDELAEHDREWPGLRLFRELKTTWGLDSLQELARAANAQADFAALFPGVLVAAESGDPVARQVIAEASTELAQLADIVTCRLFPVQHSTVLQAIPMAMAGGVFRHSPMIRDLFYNQVRAANPQVILNSDVVDPVLGALQMARRAAS